MTGIPYTHWMYFDDREAAERCAAELSSLDFLCGVDYSRRLTAEDRAGFWADAVRSGACSAETARVALDNPPEHGEWLLRAAREAGIDGLIERHEMVEAIVERHSGFYDGGETGWIDARTGEPLRQAEGGYS